jgi:hypothetical protein
MAAQEIRGRRRPPALALEHEQCQRGAAAGGDVDPSAPATITVPGASSAAVSRRRCHTITVPATWE